MEVQDDIKFSINNAKNDKRTFDLVISKLEGLNFNLKAINFKYLYSRNIKINDNNYCKITISLKKKKVKFEINSFVAIEYIYINCSNEIINYKWENINEMIDKIITDLEKSPTKN